VYVRPFPNVDGGRWQISRDGGGYPLWARSGRELFFMTSTNRLVVVQIKSSTGFEFSSPQPLFDLAPYLLRSVGRPFDISSDAQRFVVVKAAAYGSSARPSIVIVSNWLEELKRLVPTN
jgi:eukaryotic-like serine/threonine-protein kinase